MRRSKLTTKLKVSGIALRYVWLCRRFGNVTCHALIVEKKDPTTAVEMSQHFIVVDAIIAIS